MEAGMHALVTGSAGFLGRHISAALRRNGWSQVEIDVLDGPGHDAFDTFRSDDTRYDLVVHCAAVAPHRSAIDGRPFVVGAGNLALDVGLFEWASRTRPGRVVYFSSSAVYPVSLQGPQFHEPALKETYASVEHLVGGAPDGSYGWVKATGERLADWYRRLGGAVTVVRPFSGYGEDQSDQFPFGAFRDRARRREDPFVIWGDGTQVRDWIHVDDVVGATLAAVEHGVDGPVNLCTGRGVSMAELAAMFATEADYRPGFTLLRDRPAGVAYRVGDPTRLHEFYTPKVPIEEGVRRALAAEVPA
jgi:nucleoside-diphosphate-sugar epimerase